MLCSLGNKASLQVNRVEGWKKVFQSNVPKKQAILAILNSNKIDFKLKSIRRDGDVYFIPITGPIHQDEVPILNCLCP